MIGERLLFARQDGVEQAWRVVDKVLTRPRARIPYAKGTWGPDEQNLLVPDVTSGTTPSPRATTTRPALPDGRDRGGRMSVEPIPTPSAPPVEGPVLARGAGGRLDRVRGTGGGRSGHRRAGRGWRGGRGPPGARQHGAVLADCEVTWADVAKVGIFLTDLGNFAAVNALYEAEIGEHRPARSTVGVAALPARRRRRDRMLGLHRPAIPRESEEHMAREIEKTDAEWRGAAVARAVPGAAAGGHRAGLHREVLGLPRRRRVPLRRVRRRAVRRVDQVRLRHRLAELHRADGRRGGRDRARHQPRHGARGGRVPPVRRPPGPRLPRRPRPDRPALLHELLQPRPHPR